MTKVLFFQKLIDKITDYIKLKGEQLKLEVMGHVARVLAHVITFILLGLIGLFFGFFVMLTLAVYLNVVLNSQFFGYLIVTGFLLIILIIVVLMLKSGKAQRWLESLILKISEDE